MGGSSRYIQHAPCVPVCDPKVSHTKRLSVMSKLIKYRLRATIEREGCSVRTTAGGRGAELPLLAYMRQVLEQDRARLQGGTNPIHVKFALDGATMTSGSFVQEEVGAFQYLYEGEKLAD